MTWRDFLWVTKPGIVVGNGLAVAGGFLLGSSGAINWGHFFAAVMGSASVIAGSCVANNYLDREIDRHMNRTAIRPSANGRMPILIGSWYAALLYLVGFSLLIIGTNALTALLGLVGAILYVVVYGYAKRRTPYGTLIGALPGAIPPLAGYVAATGRFDMVASILFATMFAWQMPHFYAISIYRQEEYRVAKVPVMPNVKGLGRTVWEMRVFGVAFIVLCYMVAHIGGAGFMFGVAMVGLGVYWLLPMFSPNWRVDTHQVAKRVFKRSLVVLLGLCFFLSMSHVLL